MNFHPSGEVDVREPGWPVPDAAEAAGDPVPLGRATPEHESPCCEGGEKSGLVDFLEHEVEELFLELTRDGGPRDV